MLDNEKSQRIGLEIHKYLTNREIDYTSLFVDVLGWEHAGTFYFDGISIRFGKTHKEYCFDVTPVAKLSGLYLFRLSCNSLPTHKIIPKVWEAMQDYAAEFFIVFTDRFGNQLWYWTKMDRERLGVEVWNRRLYKINSGSSNLFVQKLLSLYTDIDEFSEAGLRGGILRVENKIRGFLSHLYTDIEVFDSSIPQTT